ncbi:hypothetical protein CQR44_0486 [Bifidobacterium asteroides]|uniref:Uncharacterized protein n=1 Tax=Bifidobacterium asteroides TaxID=1684 RepID=A0A2N3RBU0_9BIFI|nr:hypothetical protein CQR44_0486 [Bifidobacterium asteroides]
MSNEIADIAVLLFFSAFLLYQPIDGFWDFVSL